MNACTRAGCDGHIAADGYCNTCGYAGTHSTLSPVAAHAPPPPAPGATPSSPSVAPLRPPAPAPAAAAGAAGVAHAATHAGSACTESGCGGTIASDGYCNTCGLQPSQTPTPAAGSSGSPETATTATATIAVPQSPTTSQRVTSGKGASRRTRTTRSTSRRDELGAGLVSIAATLAGDPAKAVMSEDRLAKALGEIPEAERFCSSCQEPVGRGHGHEPGRVKGFCGNCRTRFDFVTNEPKLVAGEMVGNQYRILGPIAHGGMGWIYLGQDTAVSDRWVVLKGLLNEDDEDAVASAVAEREFLARIDHGSIVNIYNFVKWKGAGYIVMEYVGGQSLTSKLKDRRAENGGKPNPLPVTEALAYILGVLPALGYLHDSGFVYNDFKPANMMAVGDGVKLIDVGGVMRIDDDSAAIFGTQGFQAPEVASLGPSISSDLYTVGRTLAVLSLNFVYHQGQYQYALPTPADEPLFERFESLYRLLLKATAAHPDDRFQTADEMGEQMLGVLREIVAISERSPRLSTSSLFGGDRLAGIMLEDDTIVDADWRSLPTPKVSPDDQGAPFLYDLPELSPEATIRLIDEGLASGSAPDTIEVRLRRAREMIDAGQTPSDILRSVEHFDPWDWRVKWYRSVMSLAAMQSGKVNNSPELVSLAVQAAEDFSQVWTDLPGELAPKLAVALAAELAGEYGRAAQLYAEVIGVDSSYVSAAFGLARSRAAIGDRNGAVEAYRAVPASSATYTEAQVASARVLVGTNTAAAPTHADLSEASRTIRAARIDATAKSELAAEILEQALGGVVAGTIPEDESAKVFGNPLTEDGLRSSLETAYRDLARVAETAEERFSLVDKANSVRVRSVI